MRNGTNGGTTQRAILPEARTTREGDATTEAEEAVARLLRLVGDDPTREGLRDTPRRVVRALLEFTRGYEEDPAQVLGRVFRDAHEEMVLVRDVPFASLCEHHLLPVEGTAALGYIPDGGVIGLSKLSRIVQTFARRLQLQERMTDEIAHAIDVHVRPRGVAVQISAKHACMALRGVRTPGTMITTSHLGEMQEPERRERFLRLAS